jgi:sugar phosphate isomerase/epimerase
MLTRRTLLAGAALARAGHAAAPESGSGKLKLSVFSKHFQWTDWRETAALAAEVGFDGVDLTLRAGGHVLPERVAEDLPRVVEILRQAGLAAEMVTAGIVDVKSPHAETILKTLKSVGIRYYRWGGFRYADKASIAEQLLGFEARARDLAALNRQYGVCAMYHTHSGAGQMGASIWDIWYILRQLDSQYIGINYDIGHATVEGGLGGWLHTSRLAAPMMRGVALKDFFWAKNARGDWTPQWCAPGQGMVNFRRFFGLLREFGFQGPLQVHFEYPELGSAHTGGKLDIEKTKFLAMLRRDLAFFREQMRAAQLT